MSKFEKVFLAIVVLLLIAQFFQPKKNKGEYNLKSFLAETQPSEKVKTILFNACFDCHSNNTHYPWYFQITPLNFKIASHIKEGKEHANFSEWDLYNKDQKKYIIKEVEEVLEKQEMPLKTYAWIHDEATLNKKEYDLLLNWIKNIKK